MSKDLRMQFTKKQHCHSLKVLFVSGLSHAGPSKPGTGYDTPFVPTSEALRLSLYVFKIRVVKFYIQDNHEATISYKVQK